MNDILYCEIFRLKLAKIEINIFSILFRYMILEINFLNKEIIFHIYYILILTHTIFPISSF